MKKGNSNCNRSNIIGSHKKLVIVLLVIFVWATGTFNTLSFDRTTNVDPPIKVAWILSYPNSGTTYSLANIGQLSQAGTGSNYEFEVYHEQVTRNGPWYGRDDGRTTVTSSQYLLTKTHCDGYCNVCAAKYTAISQRGFEDGCRTAVYRYLPGRETRSSIKSVLCMLFGFAFEDRLVYPQSVVKRAIHMIRHPIDNMVARINFQFRSAHKGVAFKSNRMYAGTDWDALSRREQILTWCRLSDGTYGKRIMRYQSRSVAKLIRAQMPLCAGEIFKYVKWHNHALEMLHRMELDREEGFPTHRFFYEDYSVNYNKTVLDLLEFTNLPLKRWDKARPFIANKTYVDILTRDEQMQIYEYIRQLASPELWSVLNERYRLIS